MRIEYLRYFIEVARCQSINKASKNLRLTQANLSKMMTALERHFATPQFERSNRGITLTEHGQHVLEWSQKVMAEQHQLIQAFAEDKTNQNRQGKLTILCPANIPTSRSVITPLLKTCLTSMVWTTSNFLSATYLPSMIFLQKGQYITLGAAETIKYCEYENRLLALVFV